jgi:hypothetical protein
MFFIPYIDIKPNFPGHDFPSNIKTAIGKLKYELNISEIMDKLHVNQAFVDYVTGSNYSFIPLTNEYYSKEVAQCFDIYGGKYTVTIDDVEYIIKIYFYKIKQTELISKSIINKFKTIFQYDYFVKNNILNMTWHYYSLNILFMDKLNRNNQQFGDLSFSFSFTSQNTQTKLFNHQKNNISRMLKIHQTPTVIPISDNMPIYFDNDLIFDMVTNEFITASSVPTFNITSGMIIDEPGTGKTLQFILYILETKLKALVLVPNDAIKAGWIAEYQKHICIIITNNGEKRIQFDILTFMELENHLHITEDYLNQYQIIGIDEIHNLYRNLNISTSTSSGAYSNLFEKIISSNIKHRWGITGTPFITDTSLFNIIKFLTGHNFKNERIANSPGLQTQFIDLFLKNSKSDMLAAADYVWSELNVHDVKVKLDIVQQHIYDAEVMLNTHKMNLRKLVCEINLTLDGDFQSPLELKEYGVMHYQQLYEKEAAKLEELKKKLQNIIIHKDQFEAVEYLNRVKHFESLVEKQTAEVVKHRKVADYFLESIDKINKLVEQPHIEGLEDRVDDADSDFCKICWGDYTIPITYFKPCGHYFCKACIDKWKKNEQTFQCPACRKDISSEDIINVQEIGEINNSPKIHELLNIFHTDDNDNDNRYIIFTQFNTVISKIHTILSRNNITSSTLGNYTNEKVLLLSSEQNAEGINLSHFDKMIIFEPFEDNVYNNQVEKQLIARIHRVGRVKPVDVYRFITEGTIEEEIYSQFS